MRQCATLLFLMAYGCRGNFAYVDMPDRDESVRTVIVVKEGNDLFLRAYDADRAPSILEVEDGFLIINVLHYLKPLAELGFSAGPLVIAREDECASLPMPPPDAIYQGAASRGLEPVPVLTDAIADLRIAIPCPCVEFEVTTFDLPQIDSVRSSIRYDAQRSILLTNKGMRLVDASAQVEETASKLTELSSAFEDQQGTFWFGDRSGQLWFGDPMDELVQTFPTFTSSAAVRVAGHVTTDSFTLLMVTEDGWLLRFDGSQWEVLFEEERQSNLQEGGLVILGPERAIATLPNGDGLLHWTNGMPVSLEKWESMQFGYIGMLDQIEGLGTFIGTRTGRIFIRATEQGPLDELDRPPEDEAINVQDVEAFRGGVIAVGRGGWIRQWHPSSGFCDRIEGIDPHVDLEQITPVGDDFVVSGDTKEPNNKGFVLRPIQQ